MTKRKEKCCNLELLDIATGHGPGGCPAEQALVGWWALRWAALPVGGGVILISRINRIRGIYDIWWFKAAKGPGGVDITTQGLAENAEG